MSYCIKFIWNFFDCDLGGFLLSGISSPRYSGNSELCSVAAVCCSFPFIFLTVLNISNVWFWGTIFLVKFQYYQTKIPTCFTFSHQYSLKFGIQMNKTAYLNHFQYLERIIKPYFPMAFLPLSHPLLCRYSSNNFLFTPTSFHAFSTFYFLTLPFFFSNLLIFLSCFLN